MVTSVISWKDKTLVQILASIKKNENTMILTKGNLHNAPPIKHYRKEIQFTANATNPTKSSKLGITIHSFDRPGGMLKTKETVENSTLVAFTNEKDVNYKIETCFSLASSQQNALQRIRNSNKIKPNYCVNTKQYLQKRGLSIEQNQFNYLRSGNAAIKPGTMDSSSNVYDGQKSDCLTNIVIYKPTNPYFACDGSVSSSSFILKKKTDATKSESNNLVKKTFKTSQYCTKYR